jgi:hypothetical protein
MHFRAAHLPSKLKPAGINPLVRIGSQFDGGYIISSQLLPQIVSILTFGLGFNWDFERVMSRINPQSIIHCYDHTVNYAVFRANYVKSIIKYFNKTEKRKIGIAAFNDYRPFFMKDEKVRHFVKAIGTVDSAHQSTVESSFAHLGADDHIFLKCDIEGAEYSIADELLSNAPKCVGIALEFHDVPKRMPEFLRIMDGLMQTHWVDHIHANTLSVIAPNGVPSVVEVTLSRKQLSAPKSGFRLPEGLVETKFGTELDRPNVAKHTDIRIEFDL